MVAVDAAEIELKELVEYGELDSRRLNLCKLHGVYTVAQLLHHYLEFGTFLGWRHCGQLSNIALISICKKYSKLDQNVLKLERKPFEFTDRNLALKALDAGFIDAIVFTNKHQQTESGRLQVEGRVAYCRSSGADKYDL
jgi:hypothetical protein